MKVLPTAGAVVLGLVNVTPSICTLQMFPVAGLINNLSSSLLAFSANAPPITAKTAIPESITRALFWSFIKNEICSELIPYSIQGFSGSPLLRNYLE